MHSDRLTSRHILITGGTGSFGNRMARCLEQYGPSKITILSRDEKKQYEMKLRRPQYHYVVADIRDRERLDMLMKGVDVVFHAAALKQVPSCENHPFEAVKTNIIGAHNLAEAAIRNGVGVFVALSTDKAVKPINVMGLSKAMMERIVCSQNQNQVETRFCCVRYGNVMGSRGSVIPLFQRQILEGVRLTVTDPRMTRFLMTLEQSVELVLHAIHNAVGGEVFVKKSPAATVLNLAKAMVLSFGDGDFDRIMTVGVRAGEKLHEVLVNEYEMTRATETSEYFCVYPEYRDLGMAKESFFGLEYTSVNATQLDQLGGIIALLNAMGDTDGYL